MLLSFGLPSSPSGIIVAFSGAAFILLLLFWHHTKQRTPPKGLKTVPGPPGSFFDGNARQLSTKPQQELKAWAREYGELFQLRLGLKRWVFVNSAEAVRDIFEKQSNETSSKAPMPVADEVISGGMRIVLMPNSRKWRDLRAEIHRLLTPTKAKIYWPSQELEATQMVHDLLVDNRNQSEFYMHSRRFATSVIMSTTYGRRVPSWNCDDIREVYGILRELSESTVPGAFIADSFPILARLPPVLQWWRKRASVYLDHQMRVWMGYWKRMKADVKAGNAPECFAGGLLADLSEGSFMSEQQAAFLAGTMIEAGAESTSSTINSCFKYLAANPRVQACARAELDSIVGRSKSPTFADQTKLPYIRAIVREILRIRPTSDNGVPHYTTEDITYKDFFIPKDTVVSINQYALYYDPARFQNPEEFRPERFLQDDDTSQDRSSEKSTQDLPDRFVFGAGRRICPGMHHAQNSLFITLAKVLWAYDIKAPLDSNGNEEELDTSDWAYEDGRFTVPRPFKLRFLPRFEGAERLIRGEWLAAEATL